MWDADWVTKREQGATAKNQQWWCWEERKSQIIKMDHWVGAAGTLPRGLSLCPISPDYNLWDFELLNYSSNRTPFLSPLSIAGEVYILPTRIKRRAHQNMWHLSSISSTRGTVVAILHEMFLTPYSCRDKHNCYPSHVTLDTCWSWDYTRLD